MSYTPGSQWNNILLSGMINNDKVDNEAQCRVFHTAQLFALHVSPLSQKRSAG